MKAHLQIQRLTAQATDNMADSQASKQAHCKVRTLFRVSTLRSIQTNLPRNPWHLTELPWPDWSVTIPAPYQDFLQLHHFHPQATSHHILLASLRHMAQVK